MPRQMHWDQGNNFESKFIDEPCFLSGIENKKRPNFTLEPMDKLNA